MTPTWWELASPPNLIRIYPSFLCLHNGGLQEHARNTGTMFLTCSRANRFHLSNCLWTTGTYIFLPAVSQMEENDAHYHTFHGLHALFMCLQEDMMANWRSKLLMNQALVTSCERTCPTLSSANHWTRIQAAQSCTSDLQVSTINIRHISQSKNSQLMQQGPVLEGCFIHIQCLACVWVQVKEDTSMAISGGRSERDLPYLLGPKKTSTKIGKAEQCWNWGPDRVKEGSGLDQNCGSSLDDWSCCCERLFRKSVCFV